MLIYNPAIPMQLRSRLLSVALVTVSAWTAVRASQDGQDGPPVVFRAGIDMVEVTTTVRGGDGHLVADLTRDDFQVRVDGRILGGRHGRRTQATPQGAGVQLPPGSS